jgi:hypothetical protein
MPFTGSLVIRVAGLQSSSISGAGTAIANGSAGGSHIHSLALAGSTFATDAAIANFTDPTAYPIGGLVLTVDNGAGAFSDGSGTLGGVMPILGVMKVCLFGTCTYAGQNLSVPLSVVGQGGLGLISSPLNLTVIGAPWTTGTAAVGTVTIMGSARGPASATSSTFASGAGSNL